jgi:hypothetical protein
MSYGMSICWRGPPGSGKRTALQTQLQLWAKSIGQIYSLKKQLWNAPIQGGEDNEDDEKDEASTPSALLPMECSMLHWGFDISRMSLQDKQFVKSILVRWGRGSQVIATGHTQRCLVFYHAHLLSNESILFLQAFLEENYKDTVLWMTSDYPLPVRLADWFVEIPVAADQHQDYALEKLPTHKFRTLEDEIHMIYKGWMENQPKLSDVAQIRSIVYALLHRNIRWTDGFHQWMFALESLPLTQAQKQALATICIQQPFTGSGQTVPSYRIPVLWENYLCRLRNALAPAPLPQIQAPILKLKKNTKKKKDVA